ncbi:MAG: DUF4249 domain-containing protein [Parvicellaceae bacterium]
MQRKLFKIIGLVFIIGLSSCEKVIPFSGEVVQPKIVVNSFFSSSKNWKVFLTKSLSVTDTGKLDYIDNASVLIKDEQNNIVDVLQHDSLGIYSGSTTPQLGERYRIEVEALEYNSVYAEDYLPNEVSISNVDTLTSYLNNEKILDLDIAINDPILEENYYYLKVNVGLNTVDGFYETKRLQILVNNPLYENSGPDKWDNKAIFTDFLFNGDNKIIKTAIKLPIVVNDVAYNLSDLDYLEIRLNNLTKSKYLYKKSYDLYENSSGNPFAQPVQVYSNITNGFGIFAGAQLNVFSVL